MDNVIYCIMNTGEINDIENQVSEQIVLLLHPLNKC